MVVITLAVACSSTVTGAAVAAGDSSDSTSPGSPTTKNSTSGTPSYDQLAVGVTDVPSGYQKTAGGAATALAAQQDYLRANSVAPAGCASIQAINDKAVQEGGQRYTFVDHKTQSSINQFIAPADSSDFDGFAAAIAKCATFTVTHNADSAVVVQGKVTLLKPPTVRGLDVIGLGTVSKDPSGTTATITYIARNKKAGITTSIGSTSTSAAGQLDGPSIMSITNIALTKLAAAG